MAVLNLCDRCHAPVNLNRPKGLAVLDITDIPVAPTPGCKMQDKLFLCPPCNQAFKTWLDAGPVGFPSAHPASIVNEGPPPAASLGGQSDGGNGGAR